ncbi:MAG: TonB-dependent receptor [Ignavibacteriales bacterium]|nr:TonB-dependent receptor [Ignavibacteriales bacterium]
MGKIASDGNIRLTVWLASLFRLLLLSIVTLDVAAAQVVTGNLRGRLVDSLGQPISSANVFVAGPNIQGTRGAVSDDQGYFDILALPPGEVSVVVSHAAFQQVTLQGVFIRLGRTTNLGEVQLHPRIHELPDVIVTGDKPLIDPTSTTSGANLHASEIHYLPVERNYRSIATLIPQANISYLNDEVNLAGGTGRENKYFIDGVDVTDPSFAKVGTNLPYNFVKEIEVITGGYEAQYRSSLGGLINVVTHSGGNEIHGSVFGFFTNNGLSVPRRGGLLEPAQGKFSNYDIGFGIGGPVVRDELWFYAAYNPTFNRRDVDLPGLGTFLDETVTHSFAGKLTWKASERLNFVLTTTGDPLVQKAVGNILPIFGSPVSLANPDPYLAEHTEGGANASVTGFFTISDGMLFEGSLSRIVHKRSEEPSTALGKQDTVLIDTETGIWSGGSFGHASFLSTSTIGRMSTTIHSGSHRLKGGIEFRFNQQDTDLDYPIALNRHSDTLYTFLANGTHGLVQNRIYSVYIDDGWQVAQAIQLRVGLRWDGQRIIATNGTTVHTINGPFQPRIGFIYQPGQDATQKIFGSYGRFTQEWSSSVMSSYTGTSYFFVKKYNQDPRIVGFSGGEFLENAPSDIPEETELEAQHYDEFSLGYERMIEENLKMKIEGTYRSLREAINTGTVQGTLRVGNPSKGLLSHFPKPRRDYSALVISVEQRGGGPFDFLLSYVLSRNYGNYEGIYDSHSANVVPNVNFAYSNPDGLKNATGLLPNDRTHVFKFSGSYRFDFGLVFGSSFTWQTGTPLSEMGGLGWFLQSRGTTGRTPNIWDLNARFVYPLSFSKGMDSRLILDLFHIASERKPVDYIQQRYFVVGANGAPEGPNSNYGVASRHQPPMSVRLGMEMSF